MPICPNCEYEYKEGMTVCPDCGIQLVDQQEFNEHMINPEDWDVVYTCSEEYEAEMLKANLEGAGIEALIIPKKDRNFPAVGDLAVIKLVVRKKDTETALQIIQDINSNKDENEGSL
ncbi:MAG: putative signal transducing protein [Ignavibacteriales bacterium]